MELQNNSYSSYFRFKKELCTNCCECLKACPTHAIRIRKGKELIFLDQCIGCGECIRICPTGAMATSSQGLDNLKKNKFNLAILSPVIYSQFPDVMGQDVLKAFELTGFDRVVDLTLFLELFQFATFEYIKREKKRGITPYISPVCPIVIRLITYRFPNLIKHILPVERPVTLFSSEIKEKISNELKIREEDIELWHITPCPAKIISDKTKFLNEKRFVDKTIGINDIYVKLFSKVNKAKRNSLDIISTDRPNAFFSARSFEWGVSGGETSGLNSDRSLAVSGLKNTIAYLEKIDLGLLSNFDYVELRICPEGCIGGALTAVDRFIAKSVVKHLTNIYGRGGSLSREKMLKLYEDGYLFTNFKTEEMLDAYGVTRRKPLSIKELNQIDKLLSVLKGRNCGSCGAPDCKTFAEDLVRGDAKPEDCLIPELREKLNKSNLMRMD